MKWFFQLFVDLSEGDYGAFFEDLGGLTAVSVFILLLIGIFYLIYRLKNKKKA